MSSYFKNILPPTSSPYPYFRLSSPSPLLRWTSHVFQELGMDGTNLCNQSWSTFQTILFHSVIIQQSDDNYNRGDDDYANTDNYEFLKCHAALDIDFFMRKLCNRDCVINLCRWMLSRPLSNLCLNGNQLPDIWSQLQCQWRLATVVKVNLSAIQFHFPNLLKRCAGRGGFAVKVEYS